MSGVGYVHVLAHIIHYSALSTVGINRFRRKELKIDFFCFIFFKFMHVLIVCSSLMKKCCNPDSFYWVIMYRPSSTVHGILWGGVSYRNVACTK